MGTIPYDGYMGSPLYDGLRSLTRHTRDILYDVYYQGTFEIMRDDAITSRNTSDQRRIMHAINNMNCNYNI
jgi:hypothetical protein